MGWFDSDSEQAQAHQQVTNSSREHNAHLSHEVIAGAAAYEAAKAYENRLQREGKPSNHSEAKEILAGVIGAFVDREVETKGLNFIDKERAKHHAKKQAEQALTDAGEY